MATGGDSIFILRFLSPQTAAEEEEEEWDSKYVSAGCLDAFGYNAGNLRKGYQGPGSSPKI